MAEPCGCRVVPKMGVFVAPAVWESKALSEVTDIEKCPLHAAAPAMYKLLKGLIKGDYTLEHIPSVIAHAEGKGGEDEGLH